jgi:hypothetical protein
VGTAGAMSLFSPAAGVKSFLTFFSGMGFSVEIVLRVAISDLLPIKEASQAGRAGAVRVK